MAETRKRITPFMKQCFVTAGVSLNFGGFSLVMAFTSGLLPQLRSPDSSIKIDDSSGSWIAAIPGFAVIVGILIVPLLNIKCGRKVISIINLLLMILGWFCITFSTNVTSLLIARLIQGLSMGMIFTTGPILIGEYTSPRNRGTFISCLSVVTSLSTLTAHTSVSYLSWRTSSLVCAMISFITLLIVLYSPESPSWYANQGRYDECRKSFRWLRGVDEEEELKKMIEANMTLNDSKDNKTMALSQKIVKSMEYVKETAVKKEFYKPIFLMIHIYTITHWGGINLLVPFMADVINIMIGSGVDIPLLIMAIDLQRTVSTLFAIPVIRKVKRRTVLFVTISLNIVALLSCAGYTYARINNLLPFESSAVGITLFIFLMFTISVGSLPVPLIVAGEIFPLQYRSLAGSIGTMIPSLHLIIILKTAPHLLKTIGLHGTYCLYAGIVGYCLVYTFWFLPETKDRTLQDIEEDFRGKAISAEESQLSEPLNKEKENA